MAYTTIPKSSSYFNTKIYTGNSSSTQAVTGVGFQPDFTWIKQRNLAYSHVLFDAVRGVGKNIQTNSTAVEETNNSSGYLSAFDSDGFTLSQGSSNGDRVNGAYNYVGWNWKANGAGSSNTDGSITSTVSANTTSGFSIVKYVGTGSNATIGHGLNTAPTAIFVKNLDAAEQWINYDVSNGPTKYYHLNLTDAAAVGSTIWNNTAPTTSVFSVGTVTNVNTIGENYVAYCFSNIDGFSKVGSYTGNGNADGPFIYTGFKPAVLMLKKTSGTGDWFINDVKRNTFNVVNTQLYPNLSVVEENTSATQLDILSNGFKLKGTTSNVLNSGSDTYIYMAFGQPIVSTNGDIATAR